MKRIRIPFPAVTFIALWAWAWLWWGDVLWTAHERSFFAPDMQLLESVWSRPFGSLWIVGRALLSVCAWPWLGGALLAVLLTGTCCCLSYTFARRGGALARLLCQLPAVLWPAYLSFQSFDTYFKSEPGRIFGVPALALFVALLWMLFVASFRKRKTAAAPCACPRGSWLALVVPLLLAAICVWEKHYRPWTRPCCSMERLYADEDWEGIRQVALANHSISCRPMAAYYAIALVRQDALMKHLFDIRFEYDDVYMHDWGGELMNNAPYYVAECDLHAGLVQFSYHKSVEDMTMDGPTVHNLKLLTQATAMRRETKVAEKYLSILERAWGTSDFTTKWRGYIADSARMEADPTVAGIRLLEPVDDSFESGYVDPSFLGYNLKLVQGRSRQALLNSVAVCLYTKLVPPFLERAQYLGLDGILQNPIVADALAMQAIKNPDILRAVPQLQLNMQRYEGYVRMMKGVGATGGTEQRAAYADQLYESGRCYYPYYYYFGNLRATRKDAAEHYGYGKKGQSDGVN